MVGVFGAGVAGVCEACASGRASSPATNMTGASCTSSSGGYEFIAGGVELLVDQCKEAFSRGSLCHRGKLCQQRRTMSWEDVSLRSGLYYVVVAVDDDELGNFWLAAAY